MPQANVRRPMTAEERDHTAKFFKWALPCLRVFTKTAGVSPPGEWKEALDAFAGAFTVLGPYDLRTAVGRTWCFFLCVDDGGIFVSCWGNYARGRGRGGVRVRWVF